MENEVKRTEKSSSNKNDGSAGCGSSKHAQMYMIGNSHPYACLCVWRGKGGGAASAWFGFCSKLKSGKPWP